MTDSEVSCQVCGLARLRELAPTENAESAANAVIIRKNSDGNRSDHGADRPAVLMSLFRTLTQRGHDPLKTILSATQTYLPTGQLPPMPERRTSDG